MCFQTFAQEQGLKQNLHGPIFQQLRQLLEFSSDSTKRIIPTAYTRAVKTDDSPQVSSLQAFFGATSGNTVGLQNSNESATQVAATPVKKTDALSLLQSFGAKTGLADEEEIPHPDKAFVLTANIDKNNIVQAHILLYPNTYLYRDKTKIDLIEGNGHLLGTIALPPGDPKEDEFFGKTEVYHEQLKLSIPILSASNASSQFTLAIHYQGCVEDRVCYPPITKYLTIDRSNNTVDITDQAPQKSVSGMSNPAPITTAVKPVQSSAAMNAQPQSEQDLFTRLLEKESIFLIIGLFFLAGIGLTFTPCVFPMIPILSSIIAGQGETITTGTAFRLSLVYVLAMAVTYATIGAIVGYYGAEYNIQIWFQDPLILSIFAAVFVLLALSMFGFYDIQMPAAIQSRFTAISNSQQGGTLIGVGLMGFFSAIIVGPCITAPLVGALIFISQTQDWQLGGMALFALGLGMGTPLLLIGTSAGKLLPRAGAWMATIKSVFGVVMLGVAIWLLERILPVEITMALMAILIITSAIYLGALESLPASASGWRKLFKGIGIILLIYGAAYLLGAAAGSRDLIQPLKGITGGLSNPGTTSQANHLVFRQIKGVAGLEQGLADSVRQNRQTMLDFYADWCISCKEMEKYTFTHPAVLAALDKVTKLQADVTDNDAIDAVLLTSLDIYGPPAILFFDTQGNEIRHRRVVGEMSGEDFAAHVRATFQ